MKIAIDFSVNTANGEAVGSVDGQVEFGVEPRIGDTIFFLPLPMGRLFQMVIDTGGCSRSRKE
jgi:hypothetical protein